MDAGTCVQHCSRAVWRLWSRRELEPRLSTLLTALHCQLAIAARELPADVARDLDVYLVVARSLLGHRATGALGDATVDREAGALVAQAMAASRMTAVPLFGRDRVVDFTQYRPRSHYVGPLERYFRATMWLSRLEFNLVSRSSRSSAPGDGPDPRETPREELDALALAGLVAASGKAAELDRIDQVFGLLAGRREDVPLPTLAALARQAPRFEAKVEPDGDGNLDVVITAPRALGTLIFEELDHHRLPMQRRTRYIGAGTTRFRFTPKFDRAARSTLRFQIGRWSGYSELHCMDGCWISPPE